MSSYLKTFLFLVLFFPAGSNLPDTVAIQSAVDRYIDQSGFSGTILVAHQGKPIFHQSYGLAYRYHPDTLRNNYHYSIASMTKLFTAIRVLQLAEEEKLGIQDPLVDYLPEYRRTLSDQIRIHHLLLHLSGLPNEKDKLYHHAYAPEEMLEQTLSTKSRSEFGTFHYNNMDYLLLGLLIERLTDKSWQENVEQHILKPLGMGETGFLEYGYYPDHFAYTYSMKRGQLQQDPLFYIENFNAAGSMYSTTLDLLKLDQALYSQILLKENGLRLLSKSYPEYGYVGYGVWNYDYPFVDAQPVIMERRGKIRGANGVVVRLTEENYTIIILSNDDRFNPDSFGDYTNLREMLIRALYDAGGRPD